MADPLEIVEDCFGLISSVVNLIILWKNKDQYLDSVKEFVNSIGDTLKKHEADESLRNTRQLAYEGLKNQLTEFHRYLLDQQNKNSVVRFFQGNNFINGCEKYIEELQRWMTAMQLDLSLHFGEENATNFKQLFEILSKMQETRGKSQCTLRISSRTATPPHFGSSISSLRKTLNGWILTKLQIFRL